MGVTFPTGNTQLIIVPDDDTEARYTVPPAITDALGPSTILWSWDKLRVYMRQSLWTNMQEAQKLFVNK